MGAFLSDHLPRVGDEIRKSSDEFYVVKRRVWCLDERHGSGDRVNIELVKVRYEH